MKLMQLWKPSVKEPKIQHLETASIFTIKLQSWNSQKESKQNPNHIEWENDFYKNFWRLEKFLGFINEKILGLEHFWGRLIKTFWGWQNFWRMLMKIFLGIGKILGVCWWKNFGLRNFLGFAHEIVLGLVKFLGFTNEQILASEIQWGFLILGFPKCAP